MTHKKSSVSSFVASSGERLQFDTCAAMTGMRAESVGGMRRFEDTELRGLFLCTEMRTPCDFVTSRFTKHGNVRSKRIDASFQRLLMHKCVRLCAVQ